MLAAEVELAEADKVIEQVCEWFESGTWIPEVDGVKCGSLQIGPKTKAVQDAARTFRDRNKIKTTF